MTSPISAIDQLFADREAHASAISEHAAAIAEIDRALAEIFARIQAIGIVAPAAPPLPDAAPEPTRKRRSDAGVPRSNRVIYRAEPDAKVFVGAGDLELGRIVKNQEEAAASPAGQED